MDHGQGGGVRIVRRGSGFAAFGPRFYVWEEDAAELVRRARELARAAEPRGPDPEADARLAGPFGEVPRR